jgi:hypothetical protein
MVPWLREVGTVRKAPTFIDLPRQLVRWRSCNDGPRLPGRLSRCGDVVVSSALTSLHNLSWRATSVPWERRKFFAEGLRERCGDLLERAGRL